MLEAIVLAGGLGTRLRGVVPDRPKAMALIGGTPFLQILLASLAGKGFSHVILSLGFLADAVVEHFGTEFAGMELTYEIEKSPLGTGGAVRRALEHCRTDHAFIFNGDTYLDLDVTGVEATWQANHSPIIVACHVVDTARYGRLDVVAGKVVGLAEKGVSGPGLINAGCYVLPVSILDGFASGKSFSLENDYLVSAVEDGNFSVFVAQGHFIDIGVPEDYARAQHELAALIR